MVTNFAAIPQEEEVVESPLLPLKQDLREAARLLTPAQARYLVDYYYQVQKYRIRSGQHVNAQADADEPNHFVNWTLANMRRTEDVVKTALHDWADARPVGKWAMSIFSVGPVIAAGLSAHIDIAEAPTVGHIWRFAGVSGWDQVWLGTEKARALVREVCGPSGFDRNAIPELSRRAGRNADYLVRMLEGVPDNKLRTSAQAALARRPWNADLKTLVFKLGTSIVYRANSPKDMYGRFYKDYKERQTHLNEEHHFADQAAAQLRDKDFGDDTMAKGWLEKGMLPPAQIHARALRYCAKMFLSHWHEVAYFVHHGEVARKPYVIDYLGHMDYIPPFNLDVVDGLRAAIEAREGKRMP